MFLNLTGGCIAFGTSCFVLVMNWIWLVQNKLNARHGIAKRTSLIYFATQILALLGLSPRVMFMMLDGFFSDFLIVAFIDPAIYQFLYSDHCPYLKISPCLELALCPQNLGFAGGDHGVSVVTASGSEL